MCKFTILLIAFFTASIIPAVTNAQTEIWHRTDNTRNFSGPEKFVLDGAGNIYVNGKTLGDTAIVVKFDTAATKQWDDLFDDHHDYYPMDMVVDAAGNSYHCGYYNTNNNSTGYIAKVNTIGNTVWQQTLSVANRDEYDALNIDRDGNIITAGISVDTNFVSQLVVTKYSPLGSIIWSQRLGTAQNDYVHNGLAITTDTAGSVYIEADRQTPINNGTSTSYSFAALKYNSTGTLLWEQVANSGGLSDMAPQHMSVDEAGNVYMVGTVDSGTNNGTSGFIAKFGADGNNRWAKKITHPLAGQYTSFDANALDADGNWYIVGIDSVRGYIAKIDTASGDTLWTMHYGSDTAIITSLKFANNALYATGAIRSAGTLFDILTMKISTDGQVLWTMLYNGDSNTEDIGLAIFVQNNGDILVGGVSNETDLNTANGVVTFIKYHETLSGIFESPVNAPFIVSAYPNPTDRELQFTVDMITAGHAAMYVYDLAGQQIATVFDRQMDAGKNTAVWNASPLAKGTYLYEMVTPAGKTSGKFVKY